MKSFLNHYQIDKLIQGDSEVIKILYRKLFPKVASYIKNNRGNNEDAKEIFQEALFQLIVRGKANGIEIKSSFENYIFTVCANLWLKELNYRKKRVKNSIRIEKESYNENTLKSILEQEQLDLFEEKFQLLSDKCQSLLKAVFNKVPYSTIIKKFNYSNENVAFQSVFKCKKRLADLVKKDKKYNDLI